MHLVQKEPYFFFLCLIIDPNIGRNFHWLPFDRNQSYSVRRLKGLERNMTFANRGKSRVDENSTKQLSCKPEAQGVVQRSTHPTLPYLHQIAIVMLAQNHSFISSSVVVRDVIDLQSNMCVDNQQMFAESVKVPKHREYILLG